MEFKMIHTAGPFGDATSNYRVEITGNVTVYDFVNWVIKDKRQWGNVIIDDGTGKWPNQPKVSYKYGKLTSKLPRKYRNQLVTGATANGGWSKMSFVIRVKPKQ